MCGRFVSVSTPDRLADYFDAASVCAEPLRADYNVAPTRDIYVVRNDERERVIDTARWGLIPPWAKSLADRPQPINARSETVAEKRSFKSGFAHRRALIPADGFYEWQKKADGSKTPYYIHAADGNPLALAGIWGTWREASDPDAEPIKTCAILTTRPNTLMAGIHDRMPVIIASEDFAEWLDPSNENVEELQDLLVPCSDSALTAWPVSRRVNSVRENDAGLIEPE